MSDDEQARVAALEAESEALCEQWSDAPDVPADVHARIDAIDAELGALVDRPLVFDPAEMERAGAFVSIDRDGSVRIERGFVRAEDEPEQDMPEGAADPDAEEGGAGPISRGSGEGDHGTPPAGSDGEEEGEGLRPLPDRLVSDLTAWRTLALQDAFAQDPTIAFAAVLHSLVLGCFYAGTRESCVQVAANRVYFSNVPTNLRDCGPAQAIDARAVTWKERLPQSDKELWDFLLTLGGDEQAMLFAHCASLCVNAQAEIVPKYDNGRISAHGVARRIAHSDVLARAVGLDIVAAGWRPTVDGYFRSVTKPRILADVAAARGPQFAEMIDHLKKPDMAREAERLLDDAAWLPEPMRTPGLDEGGPEGTTGGEGGTELPGTFADDAIDPGDHELPVAAE